MSVATGRAHVHRQRTMSVATGRVYVLIHKQRMMSVATGRAYVHKKRKLELFEVRCLAENSLSITNVFTLAHQIYTNLRLYLALG